MDSLNTLRAVLVGGAVLALVVAATLGQWIAAAVLGIGVFFHGLLWFVNARRREPR